MLPVKLTWTNLFNMPEIDFEPAPPRELILSDELNQTLAWLTAATRHDRRLLRCDDNGSLIVIEPWQAMNFLGLIRLDPAPNVPDAWYPTAGNKGILVSTSTQLIRLYIVRKSGGDAEEFFVPPYQYYWYPHSTYSVSAYVVPPTTGDASCVGVVAFN